MAEAVAGMKAILSDARYAQFGIRPRYCTTWHSGPWPVDAFVLAFIVM